jgi:hypothetical protein
VRRPSFHKSAANLLDKEFALAKIRKSIRIDEATGCSLWQRGTNYDGYGQVGLEGRTWLVHRVVYELTREPIPPFDQCEDGKYFVLHKCDVPGCCNPDHLYRGNARDNSRDSANRKRIKSGGRINLYGSRTGSPTTPYFYSGTVYWAIGSEVRTLNEWAEEYGVNPCTLDQRLRAGWPKEMLGAAPQSGNRFLYGRETYARLSGEEEARSYSSLPRQRGKNDDGVQSPNQAPSSSENQPVRAG